MNALRVMNEERNAIISFVEGRMESAMLIGRPEE